MQLAVYLVHTVVEIFERREPPPAVYTSSRNNMDMSEMWKGNAALEMPILASANPDATGRNNPLQEL